jgi:hypothetical protein
MKFFKWFLFMVFVMVSTLMSTGKHVPILDFPDSFTVEWE